MPSPHTGSILQQSSLVSGLVTQEQIDEAIASVRRALSKDSPAPRVEVTDDELGAELIAMGLLTHYQSEQLKSGRTKLTLGPYLITDWIAQGGMGQVFKAEHQMMGREVAIKVLPHSRSTPHAISNFTREIRTQAILDHNNLVRAFDAGHDGNVYYLVCEYVRGTDLRRFVRANGPLVMEQAAAVISQAANGLHSAHQKGLIHRDVKPGNILVTDDGQSKVSDLGLAGFLSASEEDDPRKYKIVGTADYISPEQIKSPETVTPTSDIYSLGCSLYYAVTGKVPYPGGNTRDKVRRHLEETPWHPRRFYPQIEEEFVEIIADMMEKDPANRIKTAAEVALRLEPWVSIDTPLPAQQPTRASWQPPPLPATEEDIDAPPEALEDSESPSQTSQSQWSQATEQADPANQETNRAPRRRRSPPLLPLPTGSPANSEDDAFSPMFIALAIAIPVSMLIGALITLVAVLTATS